MFSSNNQTILFLPLKSCQFATFIQRKVVREYLLFITKNGMIKKSESKLYNSCSKRGLAAIKLKEGDEVLNVCLINDEKIRILTKKNNFLITDSDSVEAIGRQSTGVKGIKLQSNDYVIDAKAIPNNSTNLVAATRNGLIKKTLLSEYHSQGRVTMGNKISKVKDDDYVIKFLTTDKDCDIIIIGNEGTVKINTKEISLVSKNALGVKGTNQEITNLLKVKS
jgi:DNA gyrase subunit A